MVDERDEMTEARLPRVFASLSSYRRDMVARLTDE